MYHGPMFPLNRARLLFVAGTRPEILKLKPVIDEFDNLKINYDFYITGQQNDLAIETLDYLKLDFIPSNSMRTEFNSIANEVSRIMYDIELILNSKEYAGVIVQGDTTSVYSAAITARLNKLPIFYVESGLRSFNSDSPFPEEIFRLMTSQLATINFAPTDISVQNLKDENISPKKILKVGNTSIDILDHTLNSSDSFKSAQINNFIKNFDCHILVTSHRRELSADKKFEICTAINHISELNPKIGIIFSLHPNLEISRIYRDKLNVSDNLLVTESIVHSDLIRILTRLNAVLTDSGGIQEEAVSLGIPLLILRNVTERPEALLSDNVKLDFEDFNDIISWLLPFLQSTKKHSKIENFVFGDGKSGKKIAKAIINYFENAVESS